MTTSYVVVLATMDDQNQEWWHPAGEIEVPMGTKRSTIIERVLAGQVEAAADVGTNVPQLPLDAGEAGELLLIPAPVERLPIQASRRFVVEPRGAEAVAE